ELETDQVIVLEVRGPADQVLKEVRSIEGVAAVTTENLGDGMTSYLIRTTTGQDLREALSNRVARHNWPLRRLDLRRRSLQDRWNEINNGAVAARQAGPGAPAAVTPSPGPANPVPPSAVTK